jgi:DNA polymerase elongation subunit (family B)
MSFVDARYDKDKNTVHVVERVHGKRIYVDYPAEYTFYYEDSRGKHRTVYNNPVGKFTTNSVSEFQKEKRMHHGTKLYESDFTPIARCLERNYKGAEIPELQTAFFDIEVDFDKLKGFSPVNDPFNKVTAISTYMNWSNQMITQVIAPRHMSPQEAQEICSHYDDIVLYTDEREMLKDFLDIIEDADVLSGWNSEGYDIPYMINRITRMLSKNDTRRFCLWDKLPKKRTFERFGAEHITYDLIGRIHMDYMQLYRKYTYHEMHSYSLDAIGEYELNETKVAYDGSLDKLYNTDFKKFIAYNKQDTMLLHKLDQKLKFIDLANSVAHENTVLIPKTMGAVAVTEQAIINEAHEQGFVVPDKVRYGPDENTQAAGAYVAYPKKGLHKWIGSVDINSLYPSAIQACNMAPETIVGQIRPIETDKYIAEKMKDKQVKTSTGKIRNKKGCSFAAAWEGLFGSLEYTAVMDRRDDVMVTIDWEPKTSDDLSTFAKLAGESTLSAKDANDLIFNSGQPWVVSANGTIFSLKTNGIIPGLLKRWYAERKEMQAKLKQAIDAGNEVDIAYWDKRQLVKKINLNSLYGAILNEHCRFFDKRIGQSTTLTGRAIAQHMDAHVNQCLTGEYDHVGECIIYGDTDSAYFTAWPVIEEAVTAGDQPWDKDIAIALYDSLADECNISFPGFMNKAFNCPTKFGELIKCGREAVASNGLFITKKRYALMVIDNEGKRLDVDGKTGKIKAMGLDLKRSDTPPVVQEFLKDILESTLNELGKETVINQILDFKKEFAALPSWDKGSPKRINNLTMYSAQERAAKVKGEKARLPGHVRAGFNYNNLRDMHNDNFTMALHDGDKAIICKLKDNPLGITSVARPTDEKMIPQWFKDLPFDDELMEETQITQKVDNLLGVLDWDLAAHTDTTSTFGNLFEF